MNIVERARIFATTAHEGQVRKYTGEPYITHPAAIVEIVRSVDHTDEMLAAAWLHDVVEDTDHTIEDITQAFGPVVSDLVYYLTDVSSPEQGNRAFRKKLDQFHLGQAPADAQTIKLADIIDNTQSIVKHDLKFAKTYLRESLALLRVLSKGSDVLWVTAALVVFSQPFEL